MTILDRRAATAGLLLLAMAGAGMPATAQQQVGRWEKLGQREIDISRDRDSIPVGRLRGSFNKIKLNVKYNAVQVESLSVVYANGARDDIPLRALIRPSEDSRVIDLRGGDRQIRRIDMVLKSVRNGRGKAEVAVWGRN